MPKILMTYPFVFLCILPISSRADTRGASPRSADVPTVFLGEAESDVDSRPPAHPPAALCSANCLPLNTVEELQGDGRITKEQCAPGCVAREEVKSRRYSHSGNASSEPPPIFPGAESRPVDNRLSRLALQPTALGLKKRQIAITGIGAAFWQIEGGITDHFSVSGYTVLPVAIWGIGLRMALHTQPGHHTAVSVAALGMMGGPFVDNHPFVAAEGIQGTISVFSRDKARMVTLSMSAAGIQFCHKKDLMGPVHVVEGPMSESTDERWECPPLAKIFLAPSIGIRSAVHQKVSLQLEWLIPLAIGFNGVYSVADGDGITGGVHLVSYSIQIHGELLFTDLGFLLPFIRGDTQLFRYFPLGIPFFTIGFTL